MGFSVVFHSHTQSIGILNYSIKYEEEYKYYAVDFEKETNSLSKRIEEVSDEDMQKISKILNAKIL